ncbi:MAG: DUF3473 domain-containing protein [Candidatus Hodarchaeota archaeon]
MTIHALTIDVEDAASIGMRDLFEVEYLPTDAVVRNTDRVLEILSLHGVRGTFFVLGEVAERFPSLVRRIAKAGHEIGIHGYTHRQFFKLNRKQAFTEIGDAKHLIEDIVSEPVYGHRAPAFSIRPDTAWALEVIAEAGFSYDSSIVPIKGRRYGWPGIDPSIHRMALANGKTLIQAPIPSVCIMGNRLPACGGGYLRHFPYWFTKWAMCRIGRQRPVIVYMHPYELDLEPMPDEFRFRLSTADRHKKRFMKLQFRNRRTVPHKIERLLSEFDFLPLAEVIQREIKVKGVSHI